MDDMFQQWANDAIQQAKNNSTLPAIGTSGVVQPALPGVKAFPTANPGALPARTWNPSSQTPTQAIAPNKTTAITGQAPVSMNAGASQGTANAAATLADAAQSMAAHDPDVNVNNPEMAQNRPSAGSKNANILPMLLKLLGYGAEAASGYYQGKAGNYNPTYTQQRLEREQAQKLQESQFQQQMAMAKVNYQYQSQLANLNNEFAIKLNAAQGEQQRKTIEAEYIQKRKNMENAYDLQKKGVQQIFQGSANPTQAATMSAPTQAETINAWNAARPQGGY